MLTLLIKVTCGNLLLPCPRFCISRFYLCWEMNFFIFSRFNTFKSDRDTKFKHKVVFHFLSRTTALEIRSTSRNWVHTISYISCGVLHVHLMCPIQNHPHAPHVPTTFITLKLLFIQLSLFFIFSFFTFFILFFLYFFSSSMEAYRVAPKPHT